MSNFPFFAKGSSILPLIAASLLGFAAPAAAKEEIGNDLQRCAEGAAGPAVLVDVTGFKAATGNLRVQSYAATSEAWLKKGAWINRIEVPVRLSGNRMRVCMPVPAPGRYGFAVRHDRNGNGETDISEDGGGFSNGARITIWNMGKPSVDKVAFYAGKGVTVITIPLQYR